jgi:hypothetical protein
LIKEWNGRSIGLYGKQNAPLLKNEPGAFDIPHAMDIATGFLKVFPRSFL